MECLAHIQTEPGPGEGRRQWAHMAVEMGFRAGEKEWTGSVAKKESVACRREVTLCEMWGIQMSRGSGDAESLDSGGPAAGRVCDRGEGGVQWGPLEAVWSCDTGVPRAGSRVGFCALGKDAGMCSV